MMFIGTETLMTQLVREISRLGVRCNEGGLDLIYKMICFKFQIDSYKGFHNHAKFAPVLKVLRTVGIGPTHLKLSSVLFTNWLIRIYCSSSGSFY